jgi:hypothetical protein
MIIIPPKHISINCAIEISSMTHVLKAIGISYFEHVRLYSSGKIAWLSTDDARAKSILEKETAGAVNFDFSKLKHHRYMFAEDIVETIYNLSMKKIASNKLLVSKNEYDIRNLFQIISIKNGIYEAFVFGTNEKNNLLKSEYISLINSLEQFILFYYEKGGKLIKEAEKNALTLCDLKLDQSNSAAPTLPERSCKRYYFDLHHQSEYLTNREYKICQFLMAGHTRKEVANFLGLKTRTIDSILLNAIERNLTFNARKLFEKIKNSDLKFTL